MDKAKRSLDRTYPREVKLSDDRSVTFRLMGKADRDAVLAFAQSLPSDDLLFLRRDITNPKVVDDWIGNIESGRSVAVLAEAEGRLVGYGALHYNDALWTRHVGEIRVLVAEAYRKQGLGRKLAAEIFAIARDLGLQKMMAQMTPDQTGARVTFERLGFRPEALLADFVLDREGKPRDLLIMAHDVGGFSDTEPALPRR